MEEQLNSLENALSIPHSLKDHRQKCLKTIHTPWRIPPTSEVSKQHKRCFMCRTLSLKSVCIGNQAVIQTLLKPRPLKPNRKLEVIQSRQLRKVLLNLAALQYLKLIHSAIRALWVLTRTSLTSSACRRRPQNSFKLNTITKLIKAGYTKQRKESWKNSVKLISYSHKAWTKTAAHLVCFAVQQLKHPNQEKKVCIRTIRKFLMKTVNQWCTRLKSCQFLV